MILTLIFIGMIILGLVFIKIDDSAYLDISTDVAGIALVVFGSCFLFIAVISIIASHVCADHTIKQNQINYEGLCKRYEIVKSEYEDVSKSDIIADITEWNMEVYNEKYWSENPWVNWFHPKGIADNLEYIPLEKNNKEVE